MHIAYERCDFAWPEQRATAASWLGYSGLARQAPELSAVIIAVCLSVPMAAYIAVRGHPRRHNLEMTGSTIGSAS